MRCGLLRKYQAFAMQATALFLTGCAVFKIAAPTANQTVSSPVPAEVDWGQSYQSFKVILDPAGQNVDVTNQFTVTSVPGGYIAKANLAMGAGQHTLLVSGTLYTWYSQAYEPTSTQQTFTVQLPPGTVTLNPSPDPLKVSGTTGATLSVGVTVSGAATGPVSVNVTGLPSQTTASPSPFSVSIQGTTGSGTTTITPTASTVSNSYALTLSGTAASGHTGSASSKLNVFPTLTSATPASQKRGGTITLSGTNFDSNCTNDKITIAGVAATAIAPCTATSLKFAVPAGASPGATSIQVTVNSQASAALVATVTPTQVAVVGGPASTTFAVIDFTDPANPSVVPVNPGIGGTVVDCSGKTVAVGSASTGVGKIVMFDVSDPAHPAQLGSFTSNFVQLGAIKFDGTHVLAGDATGPQVVVLNAANPNSLSLIAKLSTGLAAVSSTGLGGTRGLVSGPNSSTMDIISSISMNPTTSSFNPNNGIGLTTDLSGTSAAVGSKNGGTVKLVNVSTLAVLGSQSTTLGSGDSISISGSMVAVGSNNNSSMFLINFASPTSPQISNAIMVPTSAGGWTVVLNGSPMQLVAGDLNGFDVNLFSITTNAAGKPAATLLKSVNSGVGSIASACVATF